jgi:unsaturated rhamnogalacturonyl hydrolase
MYTHIKLAIDLAENYMKKNQAEINQWSWKDAMLLFSFLELYNITKRKSLINYVRRWMDFNIENGYKYTRNEFWFPGVVGLLLYKELKQKSYLKVAEDTVNYLLNEAPKTKDGGISHFNLIECKSPTLWIDSLFMFGILLCRWSEIMNDKRTLLEFRKQILIFSKKLQRKSGFFLHSWGWIYNRKIAYDDEELISLPSFRVKQNKNIFWGRGNAWATVAIQEYLRVKQLFNQNDKQVEGILSKQINALLAAQNKQKGLWHTILNEPRKTYLETSASALFAYGLTIGYNNGSGTDQTVRSIKLALNGILSRIVFKKDDLIVKGTSMPTGVGDLNHYNSIKTRDNITYGIGAVILLLKEISISTVIVHDQ